MVVMAAHHSEYYMSLIVIFILGVFCIYIYIYSKYMYGKYMDVYFSHVLLVRRKLHMSPTLTERALTKLCITLNYSPL